MKAFKLVAVVPTWGHLWALRPQWRIGQFRSFVGLHAGQGLPVGERFVGAAVGLSWRNQRPYGLPTDRVIDWSPANGAFKSESEGVPCRHGRIKWGFGK